MKQQITKKQWDELSDEDKEVWIKKFKPFSITTGLINYPTIGQLIEYLGGDLNEISPYGDIWLVEIKIGKDGLGEDKFKFWELPEIIDALWEATKHKLKIKQ